jgi:hypothetical protein
MDPPTLHAAPVASSGPALRHEMIVNSTSADPVLLRSKFVLSAKNLDTVYVRRAYICATHVLAKEG